MQMINLIQDLIKQSVLNKDDVALTNNANYQGEQEEVDQGQQMERNIKLQLFERIKYDTWFPTG